MVPAFQESQHSFNTYTNYVSILQSAPVVTMNKVSTGNMNIAILLIQLNILNIYGDCLLLYLYIASKYDVE